MRSAIAESTHSTAVNIKDGVLYSYARAQSDVNTAVQGTVGLMVKGAEISMWVLKVTPTVTVLAGSGYVIAFTSLAPLAPIIFLPTAVGFGIAYTFPRFYDTFIDKTGYGPTKSTIVLLGVGMLLAGGVVIENKRQQFITGTAKRQRSQRSQRSQQYKERVKRIKR